MENTLGKCLFSLFTFASILFICGGVPVESRLYHPRSRRQSEGKCQRLGNPAHGKIIDLFNTSLEQPLLPQRSVLWYVCDDGYKQFPEHTLLVCLIDGSWSQDPPICTKKCPALHSTATTKIRCFDDKNKTEMKCDEAIDGSLAKFECATNYVLADRQIPYSICWSGSWNLPAPECIIAVCGEKTVSGQLNHKGDYPWATAIFIKTNHGFINTCVGSMLTQKVILTAAHCVTYTYGELRDIAKIKVGVGKYYNDYMDERDKQAQYSDVERVLVHPKFKGPLQHYSSDIACLITKDTLVLSKVVQPVCFRNLPNIDLTFEMEGVVTGWGLTVGSEGPSEKLKEIPVRLTGPTCVSGRAVPPVWLEEFNTYDKFCAGTYNGSIDVCKGDCGGGLVFKNPKDGRFYVHGLVSVGGPEENGNDDDRCHKHSFSLFTKVAIHYDWLEQIVSQYITL